MKKTIEKIKKLIQSLPKSFIGLILAIFILTCNLFDMKMALGHDFTFHVTNMLLAKEKIDIFKLKLVLPKIFGGTIANGFGYGTGIFYPPLSYYLTSYISYIFKTDFLTISVIEIITISLSGIFMYIFLNKVFKNDKIAGLGSISYISSTYILCNIYTRTAIAELLTLIFIPIVFWGLYELFFNDDKKFHLLFIIGYIGMIHSHLVLSVYLTIIIIILFLCFPTKTLKKDKIKKLFTASIIILLISSPFLVPLIEHKIFGNYVVFEPNSMYTIESITSNSLNIEDFFTVGTIGYDSIKVYINHIVLITSLITIALNKKVFNQEKRTIYIITLLIIIMSLFALTIYFPWDKMPSMLKMIQFPWRICIFLSFGLAILSGNIATIIKGTNKQLIITFLALLIILNGFNSISQDRIRTQYSIKEMSMGVQKEYLPSKTKNNIDYFEKRIDNIIIKEGKATIITLENNTPYLNSRINLETDKIVIELPRLYYLGYIIELTDDNGNQEKLKYYENDNGFIELELTKSGNLEVSYKGTIANKIANYIGLITIISCIGILISKKTRKPYNILD